MNRTQIDWFGFRSKAGIEPTITALRGAFGCLGEAVQVRPRTPILGFQQAGDVLVAGMKVGLVAFGGESQKGWTMVSVTGRGCEWVRDWDGAQESVAALPGYQMKRVDVALTTRDGSVTHDSVIAAHRAGQFTTRGRPPNMKRIESEDPTQGRTVYVGSRTEGKFFRAYEKGYELARAYPKVDVSHIDGTPVADLYRCEVEFKPKHAPLPVDLIDRCDQYFAGAYPFLEHLMVNVQPEIFTQVRERGPQRDLEAALAQVRHQYGSTLFTALAAYCGDLTAVWDQIVGHKHNEQLVDAGVLIVDHEARNGAQSPPAKPVLQ